MTKIAIIGNLGYIGPVLTRYLRETRGDIQIIGFDVGLFESCVVAPVIDPIYAPDHQFNLDVGDIKPTHLEGIEHVVYLAAISNDPMGHEFARETHRVNHHECIRIASIFDTIGGGNFVYASSCSVYGAGGDEPKVETDAVLPLTDYAK